ncbi:MAG TPA: 7TM-DISM domain-containing protein [Fulvivirga sp.]|nr:7TM-DISM domain-containing protein [Fulvivirga sp.]
MKSLLTKILPFFLLGLIGNMQIAIAQTSIKPMAMNGIVNVSTWNFEDGGSIELSGDWLFIWDRLITPTNKNIDDKSGIYVKFPGIWTNYLINNKTYPSYGSASYRLIVKGLEINREYALEIPDMYSSYQLWLGDKIIAKNGQVGMNKEEYRPQWIPKTVTFQAKNTTDTLILNISNFDHVKGGVKNEIWLGTVDQLMTDRNSEIASNLVLSIGITILGILSIVSFFKYSNRLFIYFTFFCFIWAIRGLFPTMYLFYQWIPDFNWIIGLKIEYLTIYSSVMIGYYIFHQLFEDTSKKTFKHISFAINSVFIILTLFGPAFIFTKLLNIYFAFMGVTLIYILNEVIKAYLYDKEGAGYVGIAIALVSLLFLYDMLSYYKFLPFNPFVTSIGYVVFYGLLGFSLRYNILNKKEVEPYRFS